MPALQVVSSRPLSGKTAIAAGLARGFAQNGASVRLFRTGATTASTEDAATFAELLFAASSGTPVPADALPDFAGHETSLIELDAGSEPLRDIPALLIVRGGPDAGDAALAQTLGERLAGTIATRVAPAGIEAVARDLTDGGMKPLAILPEDRALAAPCVDEIRAILSADLLYDGENGRTVVEDVLIGPVYADPARPHFQRFASKAVLAPFNKTDLLLVAIETQAACLVITGGRQPSPYVVDRAQGEETTVLLARDETPATVSALSDVWLTSRFRGERKTDAVFALMASRLDFAALARKLS